MWCFTIIEKTEKDRRNYELIFGYSYNDACRRAGIDGDKFKIIKQEYED